MPKCVKCGKSGLFLRLSSSGTCQECDRRHIAELKAKHEAHLQRKAIDGPIIQRFQDAEELPLPERIAAYENAISDNRDWEGIIGFEKRLAKLYRVNGQYQKAWSLLNKHTVDLMRVYSIDGDMRALDAGIASIRWEQHEISNAEGRYLASVCELACYYLLRDLNRESGFDMPAFIRRAGPIWRKGGRSTPQLKVVAEKVNEICRNKGVENDFTTWYDQYLKEICT